MELVLAARLVGQDDRCMALANLTVIGAARGRVGAARTRLERLLAESRAGQAAGTRWQLGTSSHWIDRFSHGLPRPSRTMFDVINGRRPIRTGSAAGPF
jgi:hypothetical protein